MESSVHLSSVLASVMELVVMASAMKITISMLQTLPANTLIALLRG
jgi:hypothetical protein